MPFCSSPELMAMRWATLSATLAKEGERGQRLHEVISTMSCSTCWKTGSGQNTQGRIGGWCKDIQSLKNMSWDFYPQWSPHPPVPLWLSVWTSCCRSALCLRSTCTHSSSPREWSPGHQRLPAERDMTEIRISELHKERSNSTTNRLMHLFLLGYINTEKLWTHISELQFLPVIHVVHHSDSLTHPHILFGVWAQQQSLCKTNIMRI